MLGVCLLATLLYLNTNLGDTTLTSDEIPFTQRLASRLLKYYNPSIRPVYNRTIPTTITTDVSLRQVIDVDEKRQVLKAVFWMRLIFNKYFLQLFDTLRLQMFLGKNNVGAFRLVIKWNDELLTWNPDDWNGIEHIYLHADKVWVPDMCIYNALKPAVYNNDMRHFLIDAHHTGEVNWHAPLVMETFCHFNVKYFPFDTQFCNIHIGSWVYSLKEIDFLPKHPNGDTAELRKSVEWDLEAYKAERIVREYKTFSASFVELKMILTLKRKSGFYVTYLYIPPVIIILSSLFAFCLPTGSDTKIDLAVIGLLSQTVFLLIISDLMPPDAENPPLLGECLTMLLIVQAAAVIVVVIIKRTHNDSMYKTEPPSLALLKLMRFLKYPFCMWHLNYKSTARCPPTDTAPGDAQCDEIGQKLFVILNESSPNEWSKDSNAPHQHPNGHPPAVKKSSITLLVEENRKRKMKFKYREEVSQLWRNIASMYDRMLFVVFVSTIGGISLWFLTLHPTAETQRS